MKTLEELRKIKVAAKAGLDIRKEKSGYHVVVAMGTCGIAAGAREVLIKFVEEIAKHELVDVAVLQKGCAGDCSVEPVVELHAPDGTVTTYAHVSAEDVKTIVEEHIVNGKVVESKVFVK